MGRDLILRSYNVKTDRLSGDTGTMKIVMFSDLHFHDERNRSDAVRILNKIKEAEPDMIVSCGDLILARTDDSFGIFYPFFKTLTDICPVYHVNGNYETHIASSILEYGSKYQMLQEVLESAGVITVNNRTVLHGSNGQIAVTGFEAPLTLYRKFSRPRYSLYELQKTAGRCRNGKFNILLAHNPYFGDIYFDWGADLILCGHNHGGLVRAGDRSLLSPYGYILPKYGYGRYSGNNKRSTMIITAGAGDSRVPVRINDPKEIVEITLENRKDIYGDTGKA